MARFTRALEVIETYRTDRKPSTLPGVILFNFWKPGNETRVQDYSVCTREGLSSCTCPDFEKHRDFCKHTLAAEEIEKREQALCEAYEAQAWGELTLCEDTDLFATL